MANPAKPTDWASLKNQVEDHLSRADIDDEGVSALVIGLAEAQFDRRVENHRKRKRSTATLSSQYLDLPDDWISPITVRLLTATNRERLQIVTPDQMLLIRERRGETAGRPKYVTTADDALDFYPSPDQDYTVEMHYVARIPKLSDSNTTNWLLTYYPDVYIYGALVAAEMYLQNYERMPAWKTLLEQAYAEVNQEYNRALRGSSPQRRIKPFGGSRRGW